MSGEVRARVLVVDDDPHLNRILRSMLERGGYGAEEALSGIGLAERVAAQPPDLVLLDLHMPQVDGLEALALLRRTLPGLPVIMLTGDNETVASAVAALKLGALDYLIKPVAMDRLLAAVRSGLQIQALRRERDAALAEADRLRAEIERQASPAAPRRRPARPLA